MRLTVEAAPIGLAPRQLAWQVLQAVAAGAYADGALEREFNRLPLETADRALATELAYGAIRQRRLLDAWLDALGKVPAERQPPRLRWLLHLGVYQLLFSQRVPAAAAVNTTVELAKRAGLGRLAPVANGVLRALLRRRAALPPGSPPWQGLPQLEGEQPAATILGLRHSLPAWLAELLLLWLPPQRAEAFAASCNQPPSLDLRVNPLRASRDQVLVALRQAGAAAEPLAEPQAIGLSGRVGDPRQLPGYAEGQWCVQDRSAQRIAPLLQPQPGQLILDACAAPGGKSTHLAELLGDQGEIWAVDRSEARLRRLQRNAERLGLAAIHTLAADAGQLAGQRPEWLGQVDRILLDAPCSGLGTLARHADARWRIDPGAITELVALQQQLLEALLPLLKPTGLLVYATCTVHPAENGELIAALLARHPQLHLRSTQQWWPGESAGDGFYAAVLANAPAEGAG
jgi:16S rRNA (cytosine967-C5)-methyltransferase